MDTTPVPDRLVGSDGEARRLAWEAERIDEALASVAAGEFVSSEDVRAWVESIGTDQELPPPSVRRR